MVARIEVMKGCKELAPGRAPGPDGFTAKLFQELPALTDALTALFNLIFEKGDIPVTLRRIYLIPILKPNKDPQLCSSRRPISLLSGVIKILESVMYC